MNGIEPFHVYHPDPEEATFQSWHDYRYHEVSDVRNDKSIALLERVGMRRDGHLLENYMCKRRWMDGSIITNSKK